jgi:hypothetical protein
MILTSTLLAAVAGSISWTTAIPLCVAGIIGAIWPENVAARVAGQAVATDVEALIAAYRTGVGHTGDTPAASGSVPPVPSRGSTVAGLATLAITAAGLAACANQTTAQQQADFTAVSSGLICVADATGRIVAAASTKDPDAVKTANVVVAAGGALTTDAACQAAIASGTVALAQPAVAPTLPPTTLPLRP